MAIFHEIDPSFNFVDETRVVHGQPDVEATMGNTIVRPPIVVGPEFNKSIVGLRWREAAVKHVFSTTRETVLLVESTRPNTHPMNRRNDILKLADRIIDLANDPRLALAFRDQDPFDTAGQE
jgi:hypothetical protein